MVDMVREEEGLFHGGKRLYTSREKKYVGVPDCVACLARGARMTVAVTRQGRKVASELVVRGCLVGRIFAGRNKWLVQRLAGWQIVQFS